MKNQQNSFMVYSFGRLNLLKRVVLSFFFGLSSYFRLFLEVHVRSNFGCRYFKMISALTIAIPLTVYPIVVGVGYISAERNFFEYLWHYTSWFGVMVAFLKACIKRQREITEKPDVYDFAKVSDYYGDKNSYLSNLRLFGRPVTSQQLITLIEPGIFFVIGLGLIIFQQYIGYVLLVCSIFYSLGYFGAIYIANEEMMDIIDNIIRQEELANVLVEGKQPHETRGFQMFCEFPDDKDLRQRIFETMTGDTEVLQAH